MLRLTVSLSILAVILSRVPFRDVLARATEGAVLSLFPALVLSLVSIVLVALRWRLLAGWLGLAMPRGLAVRALFLAVFGGQVLPSSIGADVLRGWLLARHTSGIGRIVASLMADRLVGLFAACLLVLLANSAARQLPAPYAGFIGPAAVLASGAVLLAFVLGCSGVLGASALSRVQAAMKEVKPIEGVTLQPRPVLLAIAIALAVHGATVFMAALTAKAYGVDASLELWMSIIPLSVIASAMPISINGWGVREAAVVFLAATMGVPAADALLVSMTLGVLNMIASLPGAFVMLHGRRGRLGMISPPPQR